MLTKKEECTLHQWVSLNPYYYEKVSYGYDHWIPMNLTLDDFIQKVADGYYFSAIYDSIRFNKESFLSSNIIVLPVKSIYTMDEYCQKQYVESKPLPTFCFDSPKKSKEGLNQFKLVYCFRDSINKTDYPTVYDALTEKVGYDQGQANRSGNAMITWYRGCEYGDRLLRSNIIYDASDILSSPNALF